MYGTYGRTDVKEGEILNSFDVGSTGGNLCSTYCMGNRKEGGVLISSM